MIKLSLFASSVREHAYKDFFESLVNQDIEFEVIFAGPKKPEKEWPNLTYIVTGDIKPAQCYEIARRKCTGKYIHWTADDAIYTSGFLKAAIERLEAKGERKTILSLQIREYNVLCSMETHSFYGGKPNTPRMAPLAIMNREYCEELGGIDRRFICGQWENDVVMRAWKDGGIVTVIGNQDAHVFMNHLANHGKDYGVHFDRPFALGYKHDREILEYLWTESPGKFRDKRIDAVEKFEEEGLLEKSQSFPGIWWAMNHWK